MVKSLKEWIEENPEHDEVLAEASPPGFSGTIRAMQLHHPELFKDKDKNAYALAWSMHKKGDTPSYKEMPNKDSRKGTPKKKKKTDKKKPAEKKTDKKKTDKKKPAEKKTDKKKSVKKVKKFSEWTNIRNSQTPISINEACQILEVNKEALQTMSAFQLAEKLRGKQLPHNMGPFAYAVMLKYGAA